MKRHEQALMFMQKAAEDETLVDEVLASRRARSAIRRCRAWAEKQIGLSPGLFV